MDLQEKMFTGQQGIYLCPATDMRKGFDGLCGFREQFIFLIIFIKSLPNNCPKYNNFLRFTDCNTSRISMF